MTTNDKRDVRPLPVGRDQRCECGAAILVCDSTDEQACSNPDCRFAHGFVVTEQSRARVIERAKAVIGEMWKDADAYRAIWGPTMHAVRRRNCVDALEALLKLVEEKP